MDLQEREISVWTNEGYEGRFLKWEDGKWHAFEHRNYRHWFSPPQSLTEQDVQVLRGAYRISIHLSDDDLIRMPPSALSTLTRGGNS